MGKIAVQTDQPHRAQNPSFPITPPFNIRAGEPLSSSEKEVLKQAIARLQSTYDRRDAALTIAAILWARAQQEVHYPPSEVTLRWARLAALQLGVDMTETTGERIFTLLSPLEGRLLWRVGHFIDTLAPYVYPGDKGGQLEGRKRSGAYITPYPIARLMVERALEARKEPLLSLLDAGTGTGVFLSAALHALFHRGFSPREALERLFGVEREAALATLARLLLALEACVEPENALLGHGPRIFTEDFPLVGSPAGLKEGVSTYAPYSIIVMNPPYERISKVDRADKITKLSAQHYAERIRRSGLYPLSSRGALDAYRLFMERALQLLSPGGSASFIVPATFLADEAAANLRRHLLDRGWIASLDLYPERTRLFNGVTQEVVILTLSAPRGRADDRGIQVLYRGHHVDTHPLREVKGLSKDHPLPILNRKGLALYKHLAKQPRLGDLTGVIVQRGELDQTNDSELMGHGEGRLLRGKHVRRFLLLGKDRCDMEALLARKRGSPKAAHIFLPRLAGRQVANRHAKERLVFAYIRPPAILGNSLNYVLFEATPPSPFDLWVLLGLLNSKLLNWFFHVNNSNNHIGLYELEALPIPLFASPQVVKEIGALATTATSHGSRPELQEELDRLVVAAFGLDVDNLEGVFPSIE